MPEDLSNALPEDPPENEIPPAYEPDPDDDLRSEIVLGTSSLSRLERALLDAGLEPKGATDSGSLKYEMIVQLPKPILWKRSGIRYGLARITVYTYFDIGTDDPIATRRRNAAAVHAALARYSRPDGDDLVVFSPSKVSKVVWPSAELTGLDERREAVVEEVVSIVHASVAEFRKGFSSVGAFKRAMTIIQHS